MAACTNAWQVCVLELSLTLSSNFINLSQALHLLNATVKPELTVT